MLIKLVRKPLYPLYNYSRLTQLIKALDGQVSRIIKTEQTSLYHSRYVRLRRISNIEELHLIDQHVHYVIHEYPTITVLEHRAENLHS
jgi:hypothetical protein